MASYSIEWKDSAAKELQKLPKSVIARILAAVETLVVNPRPDGVRKLTDTESTCRIRIGDYRVVYKVYDRMLVIEVIRVRNRKDAYQ